MDCTSEGQTVWGSGLRNIFDQYTQPENRITHALMTALSEDRNLLGSFLDELVKVTSPVSPGKLLVLEQRYPGEGQEPDVRAVLSANRNRCEAQLIRARVD